MNILVGSTGFIGSNLARQYSFDGLFHSPNIEDAFGSRPDICFYAGVPAQKFMANRFPLEDKRVIFTAMENIRKINPRQLVLISTIDVLSNPDKADEVTVIKQTELQPYGLHRYILEEWVGINCKDYCIIRLPALFGDNLKKNFIFDIINVIPTMLSKDKYDLLLAKDDYIKPFYNLLDNGMYVCKPINKEERSALRGYFEQAEFNAVYFTDSRASFPFYNLEYLRRHIDIALAKDIKLLHLAVEPIRADEVYRMVKGKTFINEFDHYPVNYDFHTLYAKMFGGSGGYIFKKEQILQEIKSFVEVNG